MHAKLRQVYSTNHTPTDKKPPINLFQFWNQLLPPNGQMSVVGKISDTWTQHCHGNYFLSGLFGFYKDDIKKDTTITFSYMCMQDNTRQLVDSLVVNPMSC